MKQEQQTIQPTSANGGSSAPSEPSRLRRYATGVLSGYTSSIITVIIGLWIVPFQLRFLGREEYAIVVLAGDLLIWLGLLDFGITTGLRVHAAQLSGKRDRSRLNELASTAFFSQLVVVSLVLLVGTGLSFFFPIFVRAKPELHSQTVQVMFTLVMAVSVLLGSQTFRSLIISHQRMVTDNSYAIITTFVKTGINISLLILGFRMLALVYASLLGNIFYACLVIRCAYKTLPGLHISWSQVTRKAFQSNVSLGLWFMVGVVATIIIENTDRLVTSRLVSLGSVTTLLLTGRVYLLAASLLSQMTVNAKPGLGQLVGQSKMDHVLRIYRRLFLLSSGSAVILGLSLWSGNAAFIMRWVGAKYYGGWLLDLLLSLSLVIHSWNLPNSAALEVNMVMRPPALTRLSESIVKIVCSIALGWHWGMIGIVSSTFVAGICTSCWRLPMLTAKMFNTPFYKFLWTDSSRVLLIGGCVFPVAFWMRGVALSLGGFIGALCAICVTALVGFSLLVVMDPSLRKQLPTYFRAFKMVK